MELKPTYEKALRQLVGIYEEEEDLEKAVECKRRPTIRFTEAEEHGLE